ncbi:hypothetical protein P8452_41072 [Trifolium repens]|nr:hypothetical protein P8452_41072 [Trifolium repens]
MGTVKLTVEYSVSAEDSWWHALRGAFPRNVIVVVLRLLLFLLGTFCHHILFEIETEVPDIEVSYQDDEMSNVPNVIEVDPVTNLVDRDVDGHEIDVEVLIELLSNKNNEEDANNSEDNEEEGHMHEEDNEDDTYCSDE